jgi:TolB protein
MIRHVLVTLITLTYLFGADATIEVTKKIDSLPSIAIEDGSAQDSNLNRSFFSSIIGDMNVLSIFNVERDYKKVDFYSSEVSRENSEIDYVLRFNVEQFDANGINVSVRFFQTKELTFQKSYRVSDSEMYPFLAHAIAYDINKYMGAESVDWMNKKVIISRLTEAGRSEIVIADYSLTYQKVILRKSLLVFPKWANKEQTAFYYTSLSDNIPTLYKMDIKTSIAKKIISSDGMMVCSDVSEDSKELLLTMAPAGQPDIYLFNTLTNKYKRLTTYSGIDVSGQFMDGNKIAFISNRLGYPNVFSKKIDSSAVEQMVYYGKSNMACSAHGDYIVYTARETSNAFSENTFNLHLISTKTDFIRRLSATGVNEFPRFSADGSVILFVKNYKNQSSIGVVRLDYNKNFLFPLKVGKIQSMDW